MKKKRNRRQQRPMDRISDLPDPIVHHIMSFLTTLDITKISILSKRFFFLWSSFPAIDFDQSTFIAQPSKGSLASVANAFLDHIQNSIRIRRIDTVLSKFRVKATLKGIYVDPRFDSAIEFALENGVRTMDLDLGLTKYRLPVSFASKSINVLSLNGFRFDLCDLITACPSLGVLNLTSCELLQDYVDFSSETLTEISLRCCDVKFIKIKALNLRYFLFEGKHRPARHCRIDLLKCENVRHLYLYHLVNGHGWIEEHANSLGKLETFTLNGCQDIQHIRVWNENLERVDISNCPSLVSYFGYKGTDRNRVCNIRFIASSRIVELSIADAGITDEWVEAQLASFGSLRLVACNSLNKVKVVHEKLQELELYDCLRLIEAEIDTPQLLYFKYRGVYVRNSIYDTGGVTQNNDLFYGLRKLLSFFGHCQSLKVCCSRQKGIAASNDNHKHTDARSWQYRASTEELLIPEDIRERLVSPLYDLQHFEIHITSMDKIETDLVDSLLWLSPLPKTLHISFGLKDSLQMIIKIYDHSFFINLQFAYNEMITGEEEDNPICCRSKPIKCWRHYLRRVEIQSNDNVSPDNVDKLRKYFHQNAMMLESFCFNKLQGFYENVVTKSVPLKVESMPSAAVQVIPPAQAATSAPHQLYHYLTITIPFHPQPYSCNISQPGLGTSPIRLASAVLPPARQRYRPAAPMAADGLKEKNYFLEQDDLQIYI
ncbi:LOW QUALITY PROTEIN: hypothetical protein OSB04_021824 [Centaurea solstitialis]|uniref:F-box domain-containing protein n=1 Tax=Centaurea solstitialis TaxID=347529 RepID=A0AA38T681_9ASTR|nr:LOW QUALITY PROTEIN: hypothetical protein OSB04_021824 [Centaurea solstitialis]